MTRSKMFRALGAGTLLALLAGCAVGPGTPLIDALKAEPGMVSANVPHPRGYVVPAGSGTSSGLIDPREREATEAYLKSLSSDTKAR